MCQSNLSSHGSSFYFFPKQNTFNTLTVMFRKYVQFSNQFLKSFTRSSNSVILSINCGNDLPKRWAGHSKWQNIKATKTSADANKAATFQRLCRLIGLAVRESGPNPTSNSKLKGLLDEAKKINMPKSTIEKAIKGAQSNTTDKPYWAVFSGPKGFLMGFEVTFGNNKPAFIANKLSSQTKKLGLKLETNFSHLCSEKGIIITASQSSESAYEKALEDAIEIGIDEVHEDDDKTLIFECSSDRVDSYTQQLIKKGYNVESSSVELDFKDFVILKEHEIQEVEKVISNIQNQHEEVIRASYNVA